MGVRITPKQNDRLTVTPLQEVINGTQVQLAANTTVYDYVCADYVLSQSEEMGCTTVDYHLFIDSYMNQKVKADNNYNGCENGKDINRSDHCAEFVGFRENNKFLSPIAKRLQTEIEVCHQSHTYSPSVANLPTEYDLISDQSRDEIRKRIISSLDGVLSSSRLPASYVHRFEEGVMRMIRNLDTNIAEFKTQLFEEIKEKTCMKSDEQLTEFEFACDEKKTSRMEKRKRNGLDY